ncbi:MAG: transporter substrate-binding domain-containing protein [Cyanobacteria bacterium P01_A01_bin.114]
MSGIKRLGVGIALFLGVFGTLGFAQSEGLSESLPIIKVGTNEIPPFVFLPEAADELPYGYSINLWQEIASEIEVKTEWQRYDSVGQMLDALLAGDIDVAIAGISITAAREAYGIDFSYPFYRAGLQLMISVEDQNFLQRLVGRMLAWSTLRPIGLVILSSSIFGCLIWLVEHRHNDAFSGNPISGMGQGMWFAIVTLGTFGYGDVTPVKLPGRLLACLWMGISFFIVADFIASLTVDQLEDSTITLEGLHGQPIGVVERTTAANFLRSHPVRVREYPNFDAAVAALEAGEVDGVLRDYPTVKFLANLNPDTFELTGERLTREDYGIAVAENRDDDLLERINREILDLQEQGYLESQSQQWFGKDTSEEAE